MWNRLGIRAQLIVLIGIALSVMELATLATVNLFDQRERQVIAVDQAKTLARSLNNDLLRAIVTADADTYVDLTFRISGYTAVSALTLFNQGGEPILQYGDNRFDCIDQNHSLASLQTRFLSSGYLCHHVPIESQGHRFGDSIIVINLEKLETQRKDYLITIALIFPIALLIGMLPAWAISRSYTEPFNRLATAMQDADLTKHRYIKVNTQAKNEIGQLFDGYNQMIDKIITSVEKIYYQSRHDFLTGLNNRLAADEALKEALKNNNSDSHVLLCLNLDDFKLINDSLGHPAGDRLLQIIAQKCEEILPDNGFIARVYSDNFYILLRGYDEARGIKIAEHYKQLLREFPFQWEDKLQATSASIGLISFAPCQYTFEELSHNIARTLKAAKAVGRNQLHIYSPENDRTKQMAEESKIANLIKEALHNGPAQFELYAQLISPLNDPDDSINYEVLIRMVDGQGNLLTPNQFLPTAEKYQLMADIDAWVFCAYLNIVCQHPKHIEQLGFVDINLAGGTLTNANFQKAIKTAIEHHNFPWSKLELEITETSAIGNFNLAKSLIEFCKNHGIGFALDDFGTGLASFQYLKNLPFDVVKIDGSFIQNMHSDPTDKAMIRYTHAICKMRNQRTIAEYVESQQDIDTLAKIGIDFGQGYFIARPQPLTSLLS